jgi:hypothetical protein
VDPVSINPAWILDNIGIPFNNGFIAIMIGLAAAGFAVLVYFIIRSGHDYSLEDADAHAEEYAGIIREAHGGLTAFLAIGFAAIVIWTIFYFVQNWNQFSVIFQGVSTVPGSHSGTLFITYFLLYNF